MILTTLCFTLFPSERAKRRFFRNADRREAGPSRGAVSIGHSAFLRKPIERLPEQRLRPLTIINSVRVPTFVRCDLIFRFRNCRFIERVVNFSAAALLCPLPVASVR